MLASKRAHFSTNTFTPGPCARTINPKHTLSLSLNGYTYCLQNVSSLAAGRYRFSVRLAGGAAGSEAMTPFTAGVSGPATTLVATPAPVQTLPLVQFGFVGSGDVSFQCSLEAEGAEPAYAPCTSPACAPPSPNDS